MSRINDTRARAVADLVCLGTPVRSAKPPPPVQIRAAPPNSLRQIASVANSPRSSCRVGFPGSPKNAVRSDRAFRN
jgi:hypothetical protein